MGTDGPPGLVGGEKHPDLAKNEPAGHTKRHACQNAPAHHAKTPSAAGIT